MGKLAVRTDLAAGTADPAGDGKRILDEGKAVVMDVAMGDRRLEPCQPDPI